MPAPLTAPHSIVELQKEARAEAHSIVELKKEARAEAHSIVELKKEARAEAHSTVELPKGARAEAHPTVGEADTTQEDTMTSLKEDKLLADLAELRAASQGDDGDGNHEVTQDPDLLRALVKLGARCQGAWDGLVAARSAYEEDQTENKVAALDAAQAFARCLEERRWLHEEVTARLLKGREWARLSEREHAARRGWMAAVFPHTHSVLAKVAAKDALDACAQTVARLGAEGSLVGEAVWGAFAASVKEAQRAHEAMRYEQLDDKPISERLRVAFVHAAAQRVGARATLQGILTSEERALDLDDLLARRRARASQK